MKEPEEGLSFVDDPYPLPTAGRIVQYVPTAGPNSGEAVAAIVYRTSTDHERADLKVCTDEHVSTYKNVRRAPEGNVPTPGHWNWPMMIFGMDKVKAKAEEIEEAETASADAGESEPAEQQEENSSEPDTAGETETEEAPAEVGAPPDEAA